MKSMRPIVSTLHRPCVLSATRLAVAGKAVSRNLASVADEERAHLSAKQRSLMALEDKYGAHNYHPLPVCIIPFIRI